MAAPPSTAVQTPIAPKVETEARLSSAEFAAESQQTDHLLTWLIVILAGLLAAFPIVDSRTWQSLRTGQLIDAGQFDFHSDPYCYTTSQTPWVHPGWLADYSFFRIYQALDGAGLVGLRILLFVLLTLLLLSYRRKEGLGLWGLAVILISVLAVAPRLWIRPELYSMVGLALTYYLLQRPAEPNPRGALAPLLRLANGRYWVFLPLLFALWANLDEWFLLGPVLVLLWWVGGMIQSRLEGPTADRATSARESRALLVVLLLGTAACLLNPYHVRVFELPGELYSQALAVLNQKFSARRLSASPFDSGRFGPTGLWIQPMGLTLCDWAYYALVGVGVFSFVVAGNWRQVPRLLVWLFLFGLSAWQARNVGFFAVVAGPITLQNLNRWLTSPQSARERVGRGEVALVLLGRFAFLLFLLLACVYSVAPYIGTTGLQLLGEPTLGYLNPRGTLGFTLYADPSMRAVAQWRAARMPTAMGNVFYMNFGEPGGYEAWFNPGGKNFLDFRYRLHGGVVAEYWDAYEALRETPLPLQNPDASFRQARARNSARWQQVFQKYGISHLVVFNRDVERVNPADPAGQKLRVPLYQLLASLRDDANVPVFELMEFIDGQHFALAWKGAAAYRTVASRKFDENREAFRQPGALWSPVSEPPPAGQASPLGLFLQGGLSRRPDDLEGAAWYLSLFENNRATAADYLRRLAVPQELLHLTSNAASRIPPLGWEMSTNWIALQTVTPALPYLAVRSARRAIAAVPSVSSIEERMYRASAYRQLAVAYESLADIEKQTTQGLVLGHREFQAVCAWRLAVENNPGDPEPHEALAARYLGARGSSGNADLMVEVGVYHLEAALAQYKYLGRLGTRPATPNEVEIEFKRQLSKNLKGAKLEDLVKAVAGRRAYFNERAPKVEAGPRFEVYAQRALLAMQIGLMGQAESELREALRVANPEQLRQIGVQAAEAFVALGSLNDLLELVNRPGAQTFLGSRYHFLASLACAAAGDFAAAERHQEAMIQTTQMQAARTLLSAGQLQLLGGNLEPKGSSFTACQLTFDESLSLYEQLVELRTVLGLYRLEGGRPAQAAAAFAQAQRGVDDQASLGLLARRYYFLTTGTFAPPATD